MTAPRFPQPPRAPRPPRSPAELGPRAARLTGALALAAVGVLMLWEQAGIRDDEASLAGRWFGWFLNGTVGTSHDVVYFSWVHGSAVGMRITSECTVALLTGPLCLLGAALLAFGRPRWHRLLIGLLVGLVVAILVNQLRLGLIAVAMQHWGISGYHVSHKFVGTVIALAGFVAAVLAMLKIATSSASAQGIHRVGRGSS